MTFIRTFSEVGKDDASIAGGKGASLGEMTRAAVPVPPGYIVLTDAFEAFLKQADLVQEISAILHTVNHEEIHTVEHASEKIQALIIAASMPADIAGEILSHFKILDAQFVAVRSSATAEDGASAAWAGQLDTFLNATEETLLQNVQRCWASLFTPRAIFYRFEKDLDGSSISVAVVVQKMIQSEVSGIAFSVHPITEDYNQLIIEAGYGLGEAIVSGQVTPDSYVVEKDNMKILDKNISSQTRGLYRSLLGGNEWKNIDEPRASAQVLSDQKIQELSELIIKIENHYQFPCDIEWAFEQNKFFITQSRPITTLTPKQPADERVPEALRIDYVKMGRWAMLPADVETWHTEANCAYFNEYFGVTKEVLAINVFANGEDYNRMFIPSRFVRALYEQIASWETMDPKYLERQLLRFYDDKKAVMKEVPQLSTSNYEQLTTDELVSMYKANRDWVHKIVAYDQFGWIAEDYWTPVLERVLTKYGLTKGTPEYNDALFALIKPREISTTLEEKREVTASAIRVRNGESTIRDEATHLATHYGWMPVLAYGTPWTSAWYEKELIELEHTPLELLQKQYRELVKYSELRDSGFEDVVKKLGLTLADAQPFIDYGLVIDTRNEAEYMNSVCGFYLLPLYAEISRRLSVTVDRLRILFEHEIEECLRGEKDILALIAGKNGASVCAYVSEPGTRIELIGEAARAMGEWADSHSHVAGAQPDTGESRGVSASPGRAQGKARIIPTPSENDRVGPGDILITYATTVDYLPAMKKAGAIVTEVGGLTCHAAVVSREFGIPCVVSYKDAMTTFKDGDMIEVDADKGTVHLVCTTPVSQLTKIFSREKSLFYFSIWDRSDREGSKQFLDIDLKHNLYLAPPRGQNGEVRYVQAELDELIRISLEKVNTDPALRARIIENLSDEFAQVKKYFDGTARLQSVPEMLEYFTHLVQFWCSMNTPLFRLPDEPTVNAEFKEAVYRIRDATQAYTEKMASNFTEFFETMFPTHAHLSFHILPDEVHNLVGTIDPHFLDELEDRAKNGCFIFEGIVYPMRELNDVLNQNLLELEHFNVASISMVQGATGYKGVIRGPAKIVALKATLPLVQTGDILITSVTDPDFVPAMQKAAGFVTDEGGIMSHAAIVAREMKKPCVIGTKIATSVFKDGDFIEIDADQGIVRKL